MRRWNPLLIVPFTTWMVITLMFLGCYSPSSVESRTSPRVTPSPADVASSLHGLATGCTLNGDDNTPGSAGGGGGKSILSSVLMLKETLDLLPFIYGSDASFIRLNNISILGLDTYAVHRVQSVPPEIPSSNLRYNNPGDVVEGIIHWNRIICQGGYHIFSKMAGVFPMEGTGKFRLILSNVTLRLIFSYDEQGPDDRSDPNLKVDIDDVDFSENVLQTRSEYPYPEEEEAFLSATDQTHDINQVFLWRIGKSFMDSYYEKLSQCLSKHVKSPAPHI